MNRPHFHPPLKVPPSGWNFSRAQRVARNLLGPWARVATDSDGRIHVGIQVGSRFESAGSGSSYFDAIMEALVKPAVAAHQASNPAPPTDTLPPRPVLFDGAMDVVDTQRVVDALRTWTDDSPPMLVPVGQ